MTLVVLSVMVVAVVHVITVVVVVDVIFVDASFSNSNPVVTGSFSLCEYQTNPDSLTCGGMGKTMLDNLLKDGNFRFNVLHF